VSAKGERWDQKSKAATGRDGTRQPNPREEQGCIQDPKAVPMDGATRKG
jgi:hypothetical protein